MLDTGKLKKFASKARADLMDQVSAKLDHVLSTDSAELREKEKALQELKKQISATSKEAVIERVAYTWFNRFCALRFMDVNRYSRMGIVSPVEGSTQPEILAEAKQGHIDERYLEGEKAQRVFKLLNGTLSSKNPQTEAYRILIVAACNYYHRAMPYLFERIEDYTELLMPDDLLSDNSIIADVRQAIGMDDCKDVEIIGWLYQYYISAKKDAVFEALKKKKKKIGADDIPAATQLFTPHWIVRYLVENSLGRLWLLNNPNSNLKSKMEYYIEPEEAETDFLKISSPEEIKVCDPACGSGHMLTYAFDLIYAIYEEQGYDATEIPELILTKNLYGIEIDERAGSLAAFALSMKARDKNRRFLEKNIQPNICVLENISFTDKELAPYRKELGQDLFSQPLLQTLGQFAEADNFGSLIQPAMENPQTALEELERKDFTNDLFLQPIHQNVIKALTQADYLSQKYNIVVANPPYMNGNNMNVSLKKYLAASYAEEKSDLMTCFMSRAQKFIKGNAYWGMINLPSWMFLSSFEKFRKTFIKDQSIQTFLHLGRGIFGSDFGSVAFTVKNTSPTSDTVGYYRRLFERHVEVRNPIEIKNLFLEKESGKFLTKQVDLRKIPGWPMAYWVSEDLRNAFANNKKIGDISPGKFGMSTGDPNIILNWQEVSLNRVKFNSINSSEFNTDTPFAPYDKGGEFRRWFGNRNQIINWKNDGQATRSNPKSAVRNASYFCQEHISWTLVTAGTFSCREFEQGFLLDTASNAIYKSKEIEIDLLLALLNSSFFKYLGPILNPTVNFSCGVMDNTPIISLDKENKQYVIDISQNCKRISKEDWNAYETSWNFEYLPLLNEANITTRLDDAYRNLRSSWQEMTDEMKRLEEENNRIFIDAYGLQEELTADVPLEEITLTCNPYYRYGGKNTPEELEAKLLSDTMQEFIHYAVGCLFGRYSIDKPGLILANQGDTIAEYKARVPNSRFDADEDNVIPVLDENWFEDDIVERFQKFLRVTFGEEHYKENLEFIENAIGKNLRKYFTKDFYDYHVRRFKKRPIYWMFSSPKGTFNALIYMHRYRPDTASVVLNDYLRDFRSKLEAKKADCEQTQISTTASEAEKVRAIKEIDKIKLMLDELNHWEKDVLHPLATQRIEIDLDDGVKVNYPKFGAALKPIKGLEANDE